ncbi:carbon monoxide dehydrogenase subunit G [Cupriavidus pauculus]|uniref:Carbon monoxide dehydrogenase subunit G n=1 Tax=Cupriavidus pauculus TaxID=82633 RepID=A0A5P2H9N0_9BURK|nr:carbon monoxide dehydrogenase subunit G [Cupriavidus pauculus]QET04782.1 carbon monoxide dehydrogenase subunit G [Cupriavidus pauculus]
MELAGEQIIHAPRQRVWAALNDPTILSRCIPGCEEVSQISDTETQARVQLKIGPVRARFGGRILMSDIDAPSRCRLTFEGAGGAAGFAKGSSTVELTDSGAHTSLRYAVEASVGGKLGQIGGRLIDSSAKKMADEFFTAFDIALRDDGAAANGSATFAPSPAASSSVVSTGRAKSGANPGARSGARSGALYGELQRAFWFLFGAAFTFAIMHWRT